jgi:transposase
MRGAFARALRRVPRARRVYVDETGATTSMTRLRGRAPPGVRVRGAVPHAAWQVVTLVGALRADGPTAAMAFAGATDGPAFQAFVGGVLCPTLRRGDVVILDRLGAHRGPGVRQAVEAAGAGLLYLPPYSDDLDPIEDVWAKVKQHLRSAEPRTVPAVIDAMGDALRAVTPADAAGFFRHRDFGRRDRTFNCKPL